MTDRPIIFSGQMVRSLLSGAKTQTRRPATDRIAAKVQPGDRLWVRESFWQAHHYPGTLPSGEPEPTSWTRGKLLHYSADGSPPNVPNRHYPDGLCNGAFAAPDPYSIWLQRPAIHMPRWASRLTLVVTDVRRQRLLDITETDALAEGIDPDSSDAINVGVVEAYACLWDRLYGDGQSSANPEVIAITFEVHRTNIDRMEAGK